MELLKTFQKNRLLGGNYQLFTAFKNAQNRRLGSKSFVKPNVSRKKINVHVKLLKNSLIHIVGRILIEINIRYGNTFDFLSIN